MNRLSCISVLGICLFWLGCSGDSNSKVNTAPDTQLIRLDGGLADDAETFDSDSEVIPPDAAVSVPDAEFTLPDGQVTLPDGMVPMSDMGTQSRTWTTREVFEALESECAACHGEGQSSPFFENFTAFVEGIVSDERYVVIGQPESSGLLPLLDGNSDSLTFSQMPPGGAAYTARTSNDPSTPSKDELAQWIESLTEIPDVSPPIVCADFPSNKLIHRLNRLEYNRSVQLLLGTNATPADDFPSEDLNYGFDNIAQSLAVSPLLIEKYDLAAASLAAEALPDPRLGYRDIAFEAESEMVSTTGGAAGVGWNLWSNGSLTSFVTLNTAGRYRIRANIRGGQAGPDP